MKKIKDVMSTDVTCVPVGASIREIATKMKDLDAGSVPVCDGDRVVGMVTDRDIVVKTLANGLDPHTARARDVMTSPVVFCFDDDDLGDAARIMEVRKIRRLLVLSRERRMVGIVSIADLSFRGGSDSLVAETLGKISQPKKSNMPDYAADAFN